MPSFNRGQAPDIYDTRPLWISFLVWKQNKKSYTEVFYVSNENAAHVDILEFSSLGRFQAKPEGTPVVYDIPTQGRRRRVVHSTYALGTAMTHEAASDAQTSSNNIAVLDRQSAGLTRSQLDHEERLNWDQFRASFTTATSIDGVAVVSTAHGMLKPPTVGATRSNRLDPHVALSYEGVEALSIIFLNQTSNEGHFIGNDLEGAYIVSHSNKKFIVGNILDAKGRPGTLAPNDTNQISKLSLSSVASPYLGTTAAEFETWWIVGRKGNSSEPGNGFVFNNRESGRISNNTDPDTGDRKWRMWYRGSSYNRQWEGVAGSAP